MVLELNNFVNRLIRAKLGIPIMKQKEMNRRSEGGGSCIAIHTTTPSTCRFYNTSSGRRSEASKDALSQPFPDGKFDLVWSMESGEHMTDKLKFVSELARVAVPGATIIIVTWCHRDLSPTEKSLRPEEKRLLDKICDGFYLHAWCSTAYYMKLLESLSLMDIKAADWSENVAPFWPAVIRSALTWGGLSSLLQSGWKSIRRPLVMPLMTLNPFFGLLLYSFDYESQKNNTYQLCDDCDPTRGRNASTVLGSVPVQHRRWHYLDRGASRSDGMFVLPTVAKVVAQKVFQYDHRSPAMEET